MIDLHCHLLPGIDDGPKTIDESLKLARLFVSAGYSHVVATPHWISGTSWMRAPKIIRQRVLLLNKKMKEDGISLVAFPGMEIAMDHKIPELLGRGEITGLGGRPNSYLLIEPPFLRLPLGWEEIFFGVLARGHKVLLAHPERCVQLAEKNGIIDEIIGAGAYLQVNWFSFLGFYGLEAAEMARYLATKGYIHCLATDSHDTKNRHPGNVKRAAVVVEKLIGTQNLSLLAHKNPTRVLKGEPLLSMSPVGVKGISRRMRSWLHF
jgi:protein-tyrosine phosphatase